MSPKKAKKVEMIVSQTSVGTAGEVYTGQFATNCNICGYLNNGTGGNVMARSRHFARTSVSLIRVAFPNWGVFWTQGSGFLEAGSNSDFTLNAALEYAGISTPFTWSGGNPSVTIADNTTSALSDALPVSIAAGDAFFIRTYYTSNPSGHTIYNTGTGVNNSVSGRDAANGENLRFLAATDETAATGVLTSGTDATGLSYRPILLIGNLPVGKKTFLQIGDSRSTGYRDVYTGTSNDRGELSRIIGASFGYTDASTPAESAVNFIASHTKRVALAQYFSHVVCEHGVNDLAVPRVAAVVAADLATIYGYFSIPVYQTTIVPGADSSDSWATLVNQSPRSYDAERISLNNTYIRANAIVGQAAYIEVADVVESSRDSGKWAVNGTANWYTDDGVHETNTANLAVQSALASNPLFQ